MVIWYAVITVTFWTCKDDQPEENMEDLAVIEVAKEHFEFGFNFNDFIVKRDTIKSGDTFGVILERNNLGYPKIFHIAEKAKDSFDIRKLQVGKPYTLLCHFIQIRRYYIRRSITPQVIITFVIG